MKNFASYLFIGDSLDTKEKTANLADDLGISFNSSSPDITIISPKKLSSGRETAISIDAIREMKKYIFEKPFTGPYKLVVIRQAHTLTIPAQNALLKILEEPPEHAVIVLEASSKEALIETVRSRTVAERAPAKSQTAEKPLLLAKNKSLYALLNELSAVDNPEEWLDLQITALHSQILKGVRQNQLASSQKISLLIRQHAQAKQMIEASVNPKFALFNLVFSAKTLNSNP